MENVSLYGTFLNITLCQIYVEGDSSSANTIILQNPPLSYILKHSVLGLGEKKDQVVPINDCFTF